MTVRLEDPARVRRLGAICRRAPGFRRPGWWRRLTDPGVRTPDPRVVAIQRLGMTVGIGLLGMLLPAGVLQAQALTLVAILLGQSWITQIRARLEADHALAVLAQFPVPARAILGFQVRPLWPLPVFALADGMAFWAMAWSQRDLPVPWAWLPVVALTHVAMLGAVSLALLRWWPRAGCAPLLLVGFLGFALVKSTDVPLLWTATRPLLEGLAWLTPWGWLNRLGWEIPRQGIPAGLAVLGLGMTAVGACLLLWERLARSWTLAPGWREVAGHPSDINDLDADSDQAAVAPAIGPTAGALAEAGAQATVSQDHPVPEGTAALPSFRVGLPAALAEARAHQPGAWVAGYGWPGRWLLGRSDAQDRILLDLLAPEANPPTAWRWALILAATTALVVWSGGTGSWVLAGLLVVCLAQRGWALAVIAALALGLTVLWPGTALLVGLILPCVVAVMFTLPLFGGSWKGLPMGLGFLGGVPRSWYRLWRLMVLFGIARLLYGAPIVALVALAWGRAFHPGAGIAVLAGWLALIALLPVFCALQLARTRSDDIRTGRWWRTALLVALGVAQAGSVLTFVIGASVTVGDGFTPFGLVIAGVGLGGILVLGVCLVPLLRQAYRRWVDLLPGG